MEEFRIDKLDNFGRGIAKKDGKICFIENACVSELVLAEIFNDKKNLSEGRLLKIIEESNERQVPKCPYYGLCGGCNIMHMKYLEQLIFKKNKVVETLFKMADIDSSKVKEIVPTKEFFYRNKVSLKVDKKLGYFKNRSYDVVNIDSCMIASPAINGVIERLNEVDLSNISNIVIRSNENLETLVGLYTKKKVNKKYYEESLKGYVANLLIDDEVILGNNYIYERLGDFTFRVSIDSFFQVNTEGAYFLYKEIEKHVSSCNRLLDLYCGTGTIGIFLSSKAKKVIGIEINSHAISDAFENKKLNNIENIEFICSDVGKVKESFADIDTLVLDPPRTGLNKDALANIIDIRAKQVIYISCDVVTLARDIKLLKDYYEVCEVIPVDMFPNTYHIENFCVLKLR